MCSSKASAAARSTPWSPCASPAAWVPRACSKSTEESAMDLNFTPEEEAFRGEVRAFLADKLPVRLSEKVRGGKILEKADMQEWHATLNARGWLANHWPEQYGGPGWTAVEKFIFEHECA